MSVTGPGAGEPTKVGVALVDVVTGLHAAIGILAALRHRELTGEGQRVEVNLLSSLLSALVNQCSGYVAAGVVPGILGNRHPSIAPYETVPAADRPFVLAVGNDGQFRAGDALERPGLAADPRFATNPDRVAHRDALADVLADALAARPAAEWVDLLTAVGVPCGPINDVAEAVALADATSGWRRSPTPCGTPTVANPIGLSATPVTYRLPPPALGADGAEVLDGLR